MNKIIVFLCVQFAIFNVLQSQEVLNDLEVNPYIKKDMVEGKPMHKSADEALSLPFIDDFSVISSYPNQEKWLDRNVFINTNYGVNPPSIGVATFDAVDENGFVYESMDDVSTPADTLTSRYIDLSNAIIESTYLSFYYQPQGNGNAPESRDSLILNFISEDSVFRVWHANGTSMNKFVSNEFGLDTLNLGFKDTLMFKKVIIKLEDSYWFKKSFQIQFVNYANIPSIASRPSGRTNKDHWHIDYVQLDDGRSDDEQHLPDMAFVEEPTIFMQDYSSVPWDHYTAAISNQIQDVSFHVRNNENIERSMTGIVMYINDLNTGNSKDFYNGVEYFQPNQNKHISNSFDDPLYYDYNPDYESASFEITGSLDVDKDYDYPENNFTTRMVHFADYYAYDDGTAEKTYGVDADRAKVACRFTNYKADSLKAVQMYFVRNKEEDNSPQNLTFCLWKDSNGKPGELVYAETGKSIDFTDSLNEFALIELDTALYIEEGAFFIGWKQNSDGLLNVGFDVNTIRRERIYYNVLSDWYLSEFHNKGSLMMRPVFGEREFEAPQKSANIKLEIMPNPSVGEISILNYSSEEMNGQFMVFDFMGKKLFEQNASTSETINLSHLNNGMYVLTFFPYNNKPRSTTLIISK